MKHLKIRRKLIGELSLREGLGLIVVVFGFCMIGAEHPGFGEEAFKAEIKNSIAGFLIAGIGAIVINPKLLIRSINFLARLFASRTSRRRHVRRLQRERTR